MKSPSTTAAAPPAPGQKRRFVVASADEAASVIRANMGPEAKVLSVKQVAGSGLKRFLSSPKLEVIAWIPPDEDPPADQWQPQPQQQSKPQPAAQGEPRSASPESSAPPPAPDEAPARAEGPEASERTEEPTAAADNPGQSREANRLRRILERLSFDEILLESICGPGAFNRLLEQPIDVAFSELRSTIISQCQREPETEMGERIAFLGTPGSGKTTSLCKWLTREVLIHGSKVEVLRLDVDSPHFGDGLDAFCEAMSVPCHRDRGKPPLLDDDTTLLVDIPGCELGDYRENLKLRRRLDKLGIDTRVLVLNAAYENSILNAILRQAYSLEPQRIVFTHADLLQSWGKLWPFALNSMHPPVLFMGTGPNIASDYNDSFTSLMIEKTLP